MRLPLALFLGLALLYGIWTPISLSEAVVLTRSEIPLGDVGLSPYSPAYLLVLHLWSGISMEAPWLRLLSIAMAGIGLLLVGRVFRGLGGTHASSGAAWILALSPFFIAQMISVSPSALAFLVITVEFLCFLEYLRAGESRWLLAWMAAALISLLVHGGLYYLILALCLGMLLYRNRYDTRQRFWWLAQLPPLGLFLLLSGAQFERFVRHRISQISEPSVVAAQWNSLGSGAGTAQGLTGPLPLLAGLLLAVLVATGIVICRDSRRDPRHGLLALGALVPSIVWLLWLPHDFYAVAALPFLAVLASMGIRSYPRWGRQLAWAALGVIYATAHWFAL